MTTRSSRRALALCALLAPLGAHATNGYLSHGYGIKALGQAGVGIAWAQDALAPATNPAGLSALADRLDLGLTWFAPRRGATLSSAGGDARYSGDGKKNFFIPEIGYAQRLSDTLVVGLSAYGNGGLHTEYRRNPYAGFGATGTAGVNLEQLFISPAVAWKPSPAHSLGLALNLAHQRFEAKGLGVFGGFGFSSDPSALSDRGTDSSTGVGLRLGWTGELAPGLTLGATWSSKVRGKFDDYRGLFVDGGRFDVPENYGLGLAFRPNASWTLGADLQKIRYGQVAAVGNSFAGLLSGQQLGDADGPGFGWRDVTALKLAASVRLNPALTLRAGFSHARQPVPARETFFNILAPGVVEDHFTLGGSWAVSRNGELSGFLAHAPGKTVRGRGSVPFAPGTEANVRLKETIVGIGYAWLL